MTFLEMGSCSAGLVNGSTFHLLHKILRANRLHTLHHKILWVTQDLYHGYGMEAPNHFVV